MKPMFYSLAATALCIVMTSPLAYADVSAQEAGKLGKTLTPLGAEMAGNGSTIPAWDGGLTQSQNGFKEGGHYPDPYAAEKPLFIIDASTADTYKAHLSAGQLMMFKKYPDYKLPVYSTHRTAAFPKGHYEETLANATRVKLSAGGNGIVGTKGGIPFPIPKDGQEVIWNHLTRYRGDTYETQYSQVAVTRDGRYTPVRFEYEYDFHYGNLSKPDKDREDNKLSNFLQSITAPARLAGNILLVQEFLDQVKNPRQAWTYNPGQRRVRLAPNVAYDTPGSASDGLRTNDDFLLFNGATDRYEWKLLDKREMYIPYNDYKLSGNTLKLADVVKPGHLNPDATRYELHRVWVVQATLKPGFSHIYSRRTFYIDEDSWMAVLTDQYDVRGELYRFSEQYGMQLPNIPMYYPTVEVHYDFPSGRYLAAGLRNDEPKFYQVLTRSRADFTPAGLRDVGRR